MISGGRPRGSKQAEPSGDREILHADFRHRRRVGQFERAFGTGRCQRLELVVEDERRNRRDARDHEINAAAHGIGITARWRTCRGRD